MPAGEAQAAILLIYGPVVAFGLAFAGVLIGQIRAERR